ncbi:sodium-coupled monocarboxylate transporter 1-like [Clavelina lepadiformis]|uniref:sodium-coupled monocarboxylate transporter 1-like n=1 Tax=Clavelina lepadiformis TaxID=159417 RepID=UPI00404326BE
MASTTSSSIIYTANSEKTFHVADYVIFGALFLVSALIGLYFAIADRNKKSTENYSLAGRSLSGWPVALSLTASFMSAITVLGTPAEVYTYGTMFWWFFLSYTLVAIITANVFLPVFYKLGVSTTYEYLEMRFNRAVRLAATCTFVVQTVIYMGMVMYMPALALNKVTGLSLVVSIVATALVCIFYTSIGGMKAVVWNDVVQCIVMWIGFAAIIGKGSMDVGGLNRVFEIASEGGRIDFFHFEVDPRIRHSFWSILIGGTLMWLSVYAINQSMIQRCLSCYSLGQAKLSLYLNDIGLFLVLGLACMSGLVMYAVYHSCDPLTSGKVTKSDQLIPYLVMDILSVAPGVPGLLVASAFSGTLSTVSTGINALACTTWIDLLKPCLPNITAYRAVLLSKILVVVYGLLGLGVAFLASLMDKILTMALKMFGVIGGPMLGLFCLAFFTPFANSKGALSGLFIGLAAGIWLTIGSFIYPPLEEFTRPLPIATYGCEALNITIPLAEAKNVTTQYDSVLGNTLYALSYCHYSTFLVLITWGVGIIISLFTGGWAEKKYVDPKLLAYPGDICCCIGTTGCFVKHKKDAYAHGKRQDEIILDNADGRGGQPLLEK